MNALGSKYYCNPSGEGKGKKKLQGLPVSSNIEPNKQQTARNKQQFEHFISGNNFLRRSYEF